MTETHLKPSSDDHAAMLRAAAKLESENPRWIVLYGVYSEEFIAFPRFHAPIGMTVLAAKYPAILAATMRQVEHRQRGYLLGEET